MRRNWVSKENHIFQNSKGRFGFRGTVVGIGRLEKTFSDKIVTLKQAVRARDEFVAASLKQQKHKLHRIIRVETLADELIRMKSVKSKATRESAEIQLGKHIVPWFNEKYPYVDQLSEGVLDEYVLAQQIKTPGRKLFNDVKHLNMLCILAHRKGLVPRIYRVKNPDPPRAAGKRLSNEEVRRLVLAASPDMRLQILMAVTMGMRKSEILKLGWDRVDLKAQTIHLRAQDTKTRRARTMGMSIPVIQEFTIRAPKGPWVFPSRFDPHRPSLSNKTAWRACKRRATVKARFHDMRHTFLSVALLEKKVNPLHVAVYAGVTLAEIQRTYLHPTVEDTRGVAQAITLSPPYGKWGKSGAR